MAGVVNPHSELPLACGMGGEPGAVVIVFFFWTTLFILEIETNTIPWDGGYSAAPVAWKPILSMGRKQRILNVCCRSTEPPRNLHS